MTPTTIEACGVAFELLGNDVYQVRACNPGLVDETFIGRFVRYDASSDRMTFEVQDYHSLVPVSYYYDVNPEDIVRAQVYREGSEITSWGYKKVPPAALVSPSLRNVGKSDYATKSIQPWDIWEEYDLNPWDADIVKRILRTKDDASMTPTEQRKLDYQKIIHICEKRIDMLTKGK